MRTGRLSQQKGIAAILIVLLLSMAVGATALGMIQMNRNTQLKQVAVHASVHANNDGWAASHALNMYLQSVAEADLMDLAGTEFPLTIVDDTSREITAEISNIQADTDLVGSYRVFATLKTTDLAADASSVLNLVYRLTPGTGNPPIVLDDSVNLAGGLEMTGGITIVGSDGSLQDLTVDGDINIDSVNINEIRSIKATGDVSLGSGVTADSIYSNGTVTLKDSVEIQSVWAMGDLIVQSGSASVDTAWVNGDVSLNSSGSFASVNSIGDITAAGGGTYGALKAGGDISIGNVNKVSYAASHGHTKINTWAEVTKADVEGNLQSCISPFWLNYSEFNVGGLVNFLSCPTAIWGERNVTVPVMEEVTEITLTKVVIDVWSLKSEANYVLEYDDILGAPTVTLYDVNGIPDGTVYYMNHYFMKNGSAYYGYLCSSYSGSGTLCADSEPGPSICLGFSEQNDCLFYDASTSSWSLNGMALAPGVVWFDGDVTLSSSASTSTILVTGSVSTAGAFYNAAVNYVGYDDVCVGHNSLLALTYTEYMQSTYKARFADYYPTNLCDLNEGTYSPTSTGNIGIAAGGYPPSGSGEYGGGDIDLGARSEVFGSVLSGDVITTGGESVVHGVLTSAALGDGLASDGGEGNSFGGATTVEVDESDTYSGDEIPDQEATEGSDSGNNTVVILWSRYG